MLKFQSALVAAFVNIKIPIMIGDFVNAMARMVSADQQESLRQSFQDLWQPATQLVLYYGGQVLKESLAIVAFRILNLLLLRIMKVMLH